MRNLCTILTGIIFLWSSSIYASENVYPCQGSSGTIDGETYVVLDDVETYDWTPSGSQCTQYDWYITNGTITSETQTSVTIDWDAAGTHTIEYYNGLGGGPDGTLNVTVTDPCPPGLAGGSGTTICAGESDIISASPGANGNTIIWYENSSGGTALDTATSYTTPVLWTTKSYYAASYSETRECVATSRKQITVTVNPMPGNPTNPNPGDRCSNGSVTLSAAVGTSGNSISWYDGATYKNSGTSYSTESLTATKTFTAKSKITATGCESTGISIVATIITPPSTEGQSRFGPGEVTLEASSGGTDGFRWYTSASGGQIYGYEAGELDPFLEKTTTYYVASAGEACTTGKFAQSDPPNSI